MDELDALTSVLYKLKSLDRTNISSSYTYEQDSKVEVSFDREYECKFDKVEG